MFEMTSIRGMIIDMDGVLWRGGVALPGLHDFFDLLRGREIRFVLATNNATRSPETTRSILAEFGIQVAEDEILTSAIGAAAFLKTRYPVGTKLLVIGEQALRTALCEAGFKIVESAEEAKGVVVGMDRSLTYARLREASLAIQAGAFFLGTNPDRSLPEERGLIPGTGAILAALEATCDARAEIFGKPEPHLYIQAMQRLKTVPDHTLALGDRLETDILGGIRAGVKTALVLTGVSNRQHINTSEIQPDRVFEGLPDLIEAMQ